jgi:vacuolar-type H+-ATPase subunit F/Vma7
MKIAVIGDESLVAGFGLTGVKVARVALTVEAAMTALAEMIRDPEIGVVIIQDRLGAAARRAETGQKGASRLFPVIVEVPGVEGAIPGTDPVQALVQRIVGAQTGRGGRAE